MAVLEFLAMNSNGKHISVSVAVFESDRTGESSEHLDDSTQTHWRRYVFLLLVLLDGIISIHRTPERLHTPENVTRASLHKAVSNKWVKYQFVGNYPFT